MNKKQIIEIINQLEREMSRVYVKMYEPMSIRKLATLTRKYKILEKEIAKMYSLLRVISLSNNIMKQAKKLKKPVAPKQKAVASKSKKPSKKGK